MYRFFLTALVGAALIACQDQEPLSPLTDIEASADLAAGEAFPEGVMGGAIVQNPGQGKPSGGLCGFGPYRTGERVWVRSPSGNAMLMCHFEGLPPIPEIDRRKGWLCVISAGVLTRHSSWVRTPAGQAQVTCHSTG